ncbi:MAG: hypothetical protein D6785_06175, partial [Planctomycetota bacterium]
SRKDFIQKHPRLTSSIMDRFLHVMNLKNEKDRKAFELKILYQIQRYTEAKDMEKAKKLWKAYQLWSLALKVYLEKNNGLLTGKYMNQDKDKTIKTEKQKGQPSFLDRKIQELQQRCQKCFQ